MSVLLATYNGTRYLREQLESLEVQTLPPARVLVRDDGSSDDTVALLERWVAGRPGSALLQGERLGVVDNFFSLLSYPDDRSEFFAFCDQDDVWLPGKLERAVAVIRARPTDEPVMYCSRVELVDEDLRHICYSRIPKRVGFPNALVENVATGCTVVLNRSARDLICRRLPQRALMHDWWCYLVVSAFGRVIFDEAAALKYRQHGGNQIGATGSRLDSFKRRLGRFLGRERGASRRSDQAEEFRRCFGDLLSAPRKELLNRFLAVRGGVRERLSYSAEMDVWRQSWLDEALLRIMILMGRV